MLNFFHRVSKIISTAIFIVLVLVIILILSYILRVNYMTKNDRLGEIKMNIYTILTQSMYPTIEAGDVIVTYKNDFNKYNLGDVITFNRNDGIIVTHRIVNVYNVNGEYSYQTKGDGNNTEDSEIVLGSNVLGAVKFHIPKVGYVQQFLCTKTGFIAVIVLPSLGIIIYDILKMLKRVSKKSSSIIKNDSKSELYREKLKGVINEDEE